MQLSLASILVFLLTSTLVLAEAPGLAGAPPAIRELSNLLVGKNRDEVRADMIERLGPVQKTTGSGFRIEHWKTTDGVVTYHPASGPTYLDPKTKKYLRLLQTSNPVGTNILKEYQMSTLPDAENHGTTYWLGHIHFSTEASTYEFFDSKQHRRHRDAQVGNFFILHPIGKVEVRYSKGVTAETLLESVTEGTKIGQLVFTSADGKHTETFSITCSEAARRLEFRAEKPLQYTLQADWKSFWR